MASILLVSESCVVGVVQHRMRYRSCLLVTTLLLRLGMKRPATELITKPQVSTATRQRAATAAPATARTTKRRTATIATAHHRVATMAAMWMATAATALWTPQPTVRTAGNWLKRTSTVNTRRCIYNNNMPFFVTHVIHKRGLCKKIFSAKTRRWRWFNVGPAS